MSGASNNPVYDGHTLTSGWNNAVSNGRNQWNNVTPSPLSILRNDTSNNDVTLGVTGGQAATTTRTCSNGTITEADIVFNSSFTWYTGTGGPGSSWDAWSAAAHEFGHHIGSDTLNMKISVLDLRVQDQPCVKVTVQARLINAVWSMTIEPA